jgi:hypothetical protein
MAAYYHDVSYYKAEKSGLSSDEILQLKHKADQEMIDRVKDYEPKNWKEKLAKFIIMNAMKLKLKFGMNLIYDEMLKGLEKVGGKLGRKFTDDEAKIIASELHHPIRHKFPRRKVIVNHIDEIHAGDLMDFSKQPIYYKKRKYMYILVNVDVFSKFCWCTVIPNKNVEQLIDAYKHIWAESTEFDQRSRKPKYLWFDMERAVDSSKFNEFLDSKGVKLYHTYSEVKVSVAERMIRTLKEKCEKVKTEQELLGKDYNIIDVLPKVLEEYNFKTIHSTTKFIPADASKKENESKIQKIYSEKYDKYEPPDGKLFKVGQKCRIYKYKYLFEKGHTKRWTDEIFIIDKIQNTKPITYLLKDLNNKEIQGAFYSYELLPTKF